MSIGRREVYRECGFFSSSVCPNLQSQRFFSQNGGKSSLRRFSSTCNKPPLFQIVPTMKFSALLFAAAGFATASAVELTPDVSYTFPVLLFVGYPVSVGSLLLRHPPREPTDNNCRNEIRPGGQCSSSTRNYPIMSSTSRAAQPKIRHGFPPTAGSYGSMRREIRGVSEPVICAVGLRPHRIRRRSRPTNNDQRLPVSQSTIINAFIHTILTTLVPILFLSTFVFSLDSRPMRRIGKPKPPARPFWSSSKPLGEATVRK